jgi:hypothetical protein
MYVSKIDVTGNLKIIEKIFWKLNMPSRHRPAGPHPLLSGAAPSSFFLPPFMAGKAEVMMPISHPI